MFDNRETRNNLPTGSRFGAGDIVSRMAKDAWATLSTEVKELVSNVSKYLEGASETASNFAGKIFSGDLEKMVRNPNTDLSKSPRVTPFSGAEGSDFVTNTRNAVKALSENPQFRNIANGLLSNNAEFQKFCHALLAQTGEAPKSGGAGRTGGQISGMSDEQVRSEMLGYQAEARRQQLGQQGSRSGSDGAAGEDPRSDGPSIGPQSFARKPFDLKTEGACRTGQNRDPEHDVGGDTGPGRDFLRRDRERRDRERGGRER